MFHNLQLEWGLQLLDDSYAKRSRQSVTPHSRLKERALENAASRTLTPSDMFSNLRVLTSRCLTDHGAEDIAVPAEFALVYSKNKKFRLNSSQWKVLDTHSQATAVARSVIIGSTTSSIINTWIFPTDPSTQPVFAAEIVQVGELTKIVFIDIQIPGLCKQSREEVMSITEPLATRFRNLPADEPAPEWAVCGSQGNYAFGRGLGETHREQITEAYESYLDAYLKVYAKSLSSCVDSCASAIKALIEYQQHHMQSSPGKKFLGNLFGESWTNRFMLEFLFHKP